MFRTLLSLNGPLEQLPQLLPSLLSPQAPAQVVQQPHQQGRRVALFADFEQFARFLSDGLHEFVGTDGAFELLVVPQLLEEKGELVEKRVLEGCIEQKKLSEGSDGVEQLQSGAEVVSFL